MNKIPLEEPISTGLDIDNYTGGLWHGDIIVIAGRPGMGMIPLACTIAHNVAEDNGRVNFISLRTKPERLKERFVGLACRETRKALRDQAIDQGNTLREEVDAAFDKIYQERISLDSQPGIDIDELSNKVKNDPNFDLLIIDNLQLLTDSANNFDSRWEEMGSICRKLKSLNLKLDVPVIILSHLSREVEKRGGAKRPQLTDLSDSGAIEQIADIVMFIYRPEYYGIKTTPEGQSTTGLSEVILSRNNRGPNQSIPLYYIKNYGRFENLTTSKEETD